MRILYERMAGGEKESGRAGEREREREIERGPVDTNSVQPEYRGYMCAQVRKKNLNSHFHLTRNKT